MGIQHVYIIALQLLLLQFIFAYLVIFFANKISNIAGNIAFAFFFIIYTLNLLNCFIPSFRINLVQETKLFTEVYNPFQRNDIKQIHDLVDYLNVLTLDTDKRVYINASGEILNNSIIESIDKPYSNNPLHNQCISSDVDLRDGFPTDFLSAAIVVTTEPVELHLREGTQEVVRYLSEQIKDPASPIGKHFMKDSRSFNLDRGVVAYIYIKTSEFSKADLEKIAEYYTNYYPGYDELFAKRILGVK